MTSGEATRKAGLPSPDICVSNRWGCGVEGVSWKGDKDKARGDKGEQVRTKAEENDYLPGFLTNVGEYEVREG